MLTVSLLVAGFALVSSVHTLLFGPSTGPEWGLYALTLFVLLPAALVAGPRVADTIGRAGGPAAISVVAARAAAGLLLTLLLAKVAPLLGLSSSAVLLPLTGVWGAALTVAVRRARWADTLGREHIGRKAGYWWMLAAALACLSMLAFLSPELLRLPALGVSLAIAAGLTAVHVRLRHSRRLRRMALLLDAAVVALVVLVVTDVSSYLGYVGPAARANAADVGGLPAHALWGYRIHLGTWLGPVNDILRGRALLVDTYSQYGVGSLYTLAAFFQIAPLGYGALALLSGFLTALQYVLVYIVMRLARCPRTLAVPAIAAAVVGLTPLVGLSASVPSTGALRYGLAWLVVALAVLWTRWPGAARHLRVAAYALVALASVWSLETFVYVGATFTAVAIIEAALAPGQRLRQFGRVMLAAAGCCVAAHVTLAVCTRAFAGSWPDWSTYLAFLRAFAGFSGRFWYQPVQPWSPSLPVFVLYLVSAISLAGLVARKHKVVLERRPLLVGIAATSGLGIASFAYVVGSSGLVYVALPAVVTGALWIALIGDRQLRAPRVPRLVAVTAGFWVAGMLVVSGWPDNTGKWRPTALAHAIPDGRSSLADAVPRLWRSPPSDARAKEAKQLLDRHLPPGEPALVIVEPELTVETLVRSGRANVLPLSHPEQEGLVPDHAYPRVLAAIDRLRPGTLMLTQPAQFDAPVKGTGIQPFNSPGFPRYTGGKLIRLQRLALDRIRTRFILEEIERRPSGLAVIRLAAPRRPSAPRRGAEAP